MKIASGNECDFGNLDRHRGSRKRAAIEHWQFRDGLAWKVYRKNLLPAVHRSLEDANFALGDDVEAIARLAFGEKQLSSAEELTDTSRGQRLQLYRRETRQEGGFSKGSSEIGAFGVHRGILAAWDFGHCIRPSYAI
jgi:hypothetical protein